MGPKGTLRAIQAAARRAERDAQRRRRELERRAKEQAKLSEREQARLEVETFESRIEVLLSLHKEQGESWDWLGIVASLRPFPPQRKSSNELRAKQTLAVLSFEQREARGDMIEQAQAEDERVFQEAVALHAEQISQWEDLRSLARRILDGEPKAYIEALTECSAFSEISELGSSIHITVHGPRFLECLLSVNGQQVIPTQVKALTSTEKVSVKPMPKARFQEIYADYLCGCAFRVAREVLAVLPVDLVLVTASADSVDPKTGQEAQKPVLSVVFPRSTISELNFDRIDPSAAMAGFQHRAKFDGGRKSEAFEAIVPLTPADVVHEELGAMPIDRLVAKAQRLVADTHAKTSDLQRGPTVEIQEPNPIP